MDQNVSLSTLFFIIAQVKYENFKYLIINKIVALDSSYTAFVFKLAIYGTESYYREGLVRVVFDI